MSIGIADYYCSSFGVNDLRGKQKTLFNKPVWVSGVVEDTVELSWLDYNNKVKSKWFEVIALNSKVKFLKLLMGAGIICGNNNSWQKPINPSFGAFCSSCRARR